MKEASKLVSIISIVLIALIVLWTYSNQKPSATYLDSDSPTDFSVENVRSHLKIISNDVHHVGTEAHKNVQNYLVAELEKLGLNTEKQIQTIFNENWGAGTTVENIIARIEGTSEGKALMLLAHYDSSVPFSHGAGDDGSGIATILEGLRAFTASNNSPKNDIIILFSDAEELGLLGARAFIKYHEWVDDIGLILNFEARGSGGPSFMLMETNGKNSKLLREFLKANPAYPFTNSLSYSVYKMLPNDTDLTPFREVADIEGFNFAFIDDHFDYHTAQDAYDRLDISTLAHQGDYLMSTLSYFSDSDISDLKSDSDRIFVNFPLIKMLHYPFAWNGVLFIMAVVLFVGLVVMGIKQSKITLKGMGMGFIPFLIALVGGVAITYGLWRLIRIVHPHYTDILHGFTYNGYQYIAAFATLNLWLFLVVYRKFFKKYTDADLIVAPLVFWLIVNGVVLLYLPGAGFFIIPVFMTLIMLGANLYWKTNEDVRSLVYVVLSIPLLYMLTPLINLFPVALGLGVLFISALFLVLMSGLLIPVLSISSVKRELKIGVGILSLLFFILATINSGFNEERKKPTNIVFYYNTDQDVSYWASRNTAVDEYVSQFLGENPERGRLPEEAGMRSSAIRYHKKTENRDISPSEINVKLDTLISDERRLEFQIIPQRKVNRFELYANSDQEYDDFLINGEPIGASPVSRQEFRLITRYTMGNSDSLLHVSCSMKSDMIPDFRIFETSYDLESNPLFNVKPKPNYMMPFAFVTGDAIVTIQTPDFNSQDDL